MTSLYDEFRWTWCALFLRLAMWASPDAPGGHTVRALIRTASRAIPTDEDPAP